MRVAVPVPVCALLLLCARSAGALLVCGEQEVNTYATGVQANPALALDPTGGFVVAWTSDGSDGTDTDGSCIRMRSYDPAAVGRGGDVQVNTHTPGRQRRAAAAVDPTSGRILVVWESMSSPGTDTLSGSIQARLYDAGGIPLGEQTQVNSHTTGAQRNPRVAPFDSGGFVVVWDSENNPADSDGFGIVGRVLNGAGVPLGTDFQVNGHTTSYQIEPAVAAGPGDGFVVVWVSSGSPGNDTASTSIVARRLDGDGSPVGSDFQVNTYTTGFQDYPRVAATGAGHFVVAWRSDGSPGTDGDYESIQARRFDAAAVPVGTQFQVNTYTTGAQADLDVTGDGSGGFVVVWDSEGSSANDGDGTSIQARHYDGTGVAIGSQFEVNTHGAGDQGRPRIASDHLGGLLVTWESSIGSDLDALGSIQLQRLHETSCSTTSTTTSSSSSTSSSTTSSTTSSTVPGPTTTSSTLAGVSTSTSTSSSSSTSVSSSSTSSTSSTSSSSATSISSTSTSVTTTSFASSSSSSASSTSTTSSTSSSSTSITSTTLPTHPLPGRRLRIDESRRNGRRPGRALVVSRDSSLGIEPAVGDPRLMDGVLRITSLTRAFDERVTLSPSGWTRVRRGFRYRADDGVRIVLKPGKRLRIRLRGPDFPLGDQPPTPIVTTLRLGSLRFCIAFSDATLNAKRRRLLAVNAPASPACREPPDA